MQHGESIVYLKVNRTDADLCRRAAAVTVADMHEAMGRGGRAQLMSPKMRPHLQDARIAGPAVTAFCAPGDNLMMHRALYLAQPGDVLVVVCQAELSGAQWGDMAARYAKKKGLAGIVLHGCARDSDAVRALGFPVWSTHIHVMHPDKSGHGFVNTPVVCDGVLVTPGDLILADGDGVVCVPRAGAAEAVDGAEARMRKEDEGAAAIAGGAAVWDLSGAAAVYASMKVQEIDGACDDPR